MLADPEVHGHPLPGDGVVALDRRILLEAGPPRLLEQLAGRGVPERRREHRCGHRKPSPGLAILRRVGRRTIPNDSGARLPGEPAAALAAAGPERAARRRVRRVSAWIVRREPASYLVRPRLTIVSARLPRAVLFALSCPAMPANPSPLRVRGLRKRYADVVAVDGLDLEIAPGECFGLLGPNGAGKTTTIEICEGLLEPDAGEVYVLGLPWAERRTGAAPAARHPAPGDAAQREADGRRDGDAVPQLLQARAATSIEVIGRVQLEEKRNARVGKLSGGQKQRLALACAIVGDPDLLFLDEPTTGLDPQSRRQLWDLIERVQAAGQTIVLTTHYMDEAERLCDRVAIVDHGRVIALGSPRQLIASLGAEHVVEFALAERHAPPS